MRAISHRLAYVITVATGCSLPVISGAAEAGSAGVHNVWREVAPMTTPDEAVFATAATGDPNGTIYVAGGEDSLGYSYTDFAGYHPAANVWAVLAPLPEDTSAAAAAAGPSDMVFVMGGFHVGIISTVYGYSPTRNAWLVKPSMPTPRDFLAAATGPDGRIYALGGQDAHGNALNTVETFNPTTSTWSSVAPMPTARYGLSAVTGSDGRIYAISGYTGPSQTGPTGIVEAYDVYTNTWVRVANIPTPESNCAAIASNGSIYAVQTPTTYPTTLPATVRAFAYNSTTNTWARVANMPWRGGENCASIRTQPHIYAIGGGDAAGNPTNTVLRYTP